MQKHKINNQFYNDLKQRWYEADDDPVALLRLENKVKLDWISKEMNSTFRDLKVLDVGCGAGFAANELAERGAQVTGIDTSLESLQIARMYDKTKSVDYQKADAYRLPFDESSFDLVVSLDFLEHVEDPQKVIFNCAQVLKPGGSFIYHTFNRNWLSHLVVIKGIEWFVKNTPANMHIKDLFIKPSECREMCRCAGMKVVSEIGLRPQINLAFFELIWTGIVPKNFSFSTTSSTLLSFMGHAKRVSYD